MSLEMQAKVQRLEAEVESLRQILQQILDSSALEDRGPDDALRTRYKAKFGKLPHPAMNREKLERLAG